MNIKDMSIKELKVMAYDIIISLQKLQNDLVAVNSIIAQKQMASKDIKKEEKGKKEG